MGMSGTRRAGAPVAAALALGVLLLLVPAGADPGRDGPPPRQGPPVAPAPDAATPPPVTFTDRIAGLRSRVVPPAGAGELVVVPGSAPAPPARVVHPVRVEVERGVPVDPQAFAAFVLATLNAPAGWGAGGAMAFARTDGPAPLQVVLASPATTERLCGPLVARGTVSCRIGERAVLTHHRWVHGTEDYGEDLSGYRRYLIAHEVGHWLGHGHVPCPAPGAPAPVMLQQTLGLDGCARNPWPHP
jgi:hypothetical protein